MNKNTLALSILMLLISSCKEKIEYFDISSKEILDYNGKSAFEIIEYFKVPEDLQNKHSVSTAIAVSLMTKDTVILINKDYQAEVKIHDLVFFANKPLESDSILIPVTKRFRALMNDYKIYFGVITSSEEE